MNRLFIAFIALLMLGTSNIAAQKKHSPEKRAQWEAEMVKYKHDFLAKELNLAKEQQTQFFALYDALDRERFTLMRKVRHQRRELDRKANPSDAELIETAKLDITTERQIKDLELKYLVEFQKVLTPRQIFKLRPVETKFLDSLRKHAKDKDNAKDKEHGKKKK